VGPFSSLKKEGEKCIPKREEEEVERGVVCPVHPTDNATPLGGKKKDNPAVLAVARITCPAAGKQPDETRAQINV